MQARVSLEPNTTMAAWSQQAIFHPQLSWMCTSSPDSAMSVALVKTTVRLSYFTARPLGKSHRSVDQDHQCTIYDAWTTNDEDEGCAE